MNGEFIPIFDVVDFNENSNNYGRVIATADAPTAGNEAHHAIFPTTGM